VLLNLGQPEGAVACYSRALELKPDYDEARRNRSLVRLLLADYDRGWADYELRWGAAGLPVRAVNRPLWDGGPLNGRTILLHAEQGLGDTIQFARYVPLVKAKGGTVVLACQKPLLRLLAALPGVDRLVPQADTLPNFDIHAPLLSLPCILGTTSTDTIPASVPYLRAEAALVTRWREKLAAIPGHKVGIAWQGSKSFKADQLRSVPLERFAPLAEVPGVTLISLQKGHGSEQLAQVSFPVTELPGLDEESGPFMDTAAVMTCLDLVISTDTAIPHLAGALNVPCWMATPFSPDWRWLLDREDSPWYPSLRLFRKPTLRDWEPVFRRIAAELRARVGAPHEPPAIQAPTAPGELIDKITILQIKSERIGDAAKLRNVSVELRTLLATRDALIPASGRLDELSAQLKAVNEELWVVEDDIRFCERQGDFGPRFIELARSVYRLNDRRAALKRQINVLLGSRLIEEKGYAPYLPDARTSA
jgi:hypothetical protein